MLLFIVFLYYELLYYVSWAFRACNLISYGHCLNAFLVETALCIGSATIVLRWHQVGSILQIPQEGKTFYLISCVRIELLRLSFSFKHLQNSTPLFLNN